VAGVIAADRNNDKGILGLADHVKIMPLRLVSFFQEMHDTDLAKSIRYAVDNGAKVINMSLSNSISFKKSMVDEAVRYAMLKDVLIVKAAGNDGINLDENPDYPSRIYEDGTAAGAWINVGASGWKDDSTLVPGFSNYGGSTVDVFAPGDHLISCYPGSKYGDATGTSIAAPLVAGLAALIWEYYPKLTAFQIKDIIMRSVVKRDLLKDKCVSGGIVNAYNALKLAAANK
jgi:subtilisin family serine protease